MHLKEDRTFSIVHFQLYCVFFLVSVVVLQRETVFYLNESLDKLAKKL